MTDLSRRSRAAELMEVETAGFAEIDRTFRELATINRLTLAYRPTLAWLDKVAARAGGAPLSILDVACGHGDMLRRIARWGRRRRIEVSLTGVDLSADAIRSAEAATPPGLPIRYRQGDVFALPASEGFDVIVSSLFAHHLFDDALPRFVAWMDEAARRSWFVNDLHRHPIPYHFVRHWVRLMRFGRFVVHDAPVSVARGFSRADWESVLAQAGVEPARVEIRWHFLFRWGVGCLK